MQSILFIEDDTELLEVIRPHITDIGYRFESATNGQDGLEKALQSDYALVVLDVMLPKLDGLDVLRRLRAKKPSLPILMLSGKGEETDKVIGLELGADDYVTKPFRIQELISRIRAILRRIETIRKFLTESAQTPTMQFGDLLIDQGKRRVTLRGSEVELTMREFDLLTTLATRPGHAFSREQLLSIVWDTTATGYSDCVTSMVKRLRKKLVSRDKTSSYIHTIRGIGYALVDDATRPDSEGDDDDALDE